MGRERPIGVCCICGKTEKLTFEHIPPKKAFNDRPVLLGTFEDMLQSGLDPITKGKIQQQGAGSYSLCERCNNLTGTWYGNAFIDWCYQGLILYQRSGGKPFLELPYHIFPARILKQIISMFFSINGPTFHEAHPDLVKYVLDRERKYLNPKVKIYAYYVEGLRGMRQSGVAGIMTLGKGKPIILSEIAFPPFGYVMTLDSIPPDDRLIDITFFSRYGYDDWKTIFLKLPALPVNLYLPGDYRSKERILEDYQKNKEFEASMQTSSNTAFPQL